ncbi:MAG: hypothetical protein K1X74_20980 [Pirellulales bacterium]|nr:hypothetical protein [Pirellulales bacterium]
MLLAATWVSCVCLPPVLAETPLRINQALAAQISYLRFYVASGRLAATSPEYARSENSSARSGDCHETLAINVEDGLPTLRYLLDAPDLMVDLEVTHGELFRLRQRRGAASSPDEVFFEQGPTGPITVIVGSGATARTIRASNFWTLLLAHRELCVERILPLVELFRPGWLLAEQTLQLEDALFRYVGLPQHDTRRQWLELVTQLASEKFATRQAADRRLRQYGTAIVPFLEQLPADQLDAEQRSRIRRIEFDLAASGQEDLPENIVPWLAADRTAWIALLDRDEQALLEQAKAQLESLSGAPVEFDPAAPPQQRAAQLARLRAAFEPRQAP